MAAKNGHLSIIRSMLGQGTKNYDNAMMNAAAEGHDSIVEIMIMHVYTLLGLSINFRKWHKAFSNIENESSKQNCC